MNYVIGDIQGCYKGLKQILKQAKFNPKKDKLWAVGDLVARGPDSLKTLRYLQSLGSSFQAVLGNHDLHLIAIYYGIAKAKPSDRLKSLIEAPDIDELVSWLRTMPLAIKLDKHHFMSHAGLYPLWSTKQAIKYSDEVSAHINSQSQETVLSFFQHMYGNEPNEWDNKLKSYKRLRFIVNALTRMRYLDGTKLEFKTKCAPDSAPKSLQSWFSIKNPNIKPTQKVVFGHWASLLGNTSNHQFIALDTGYVWGKTLSLYCIETQLTLHLEA